MRINILLTIFSLVFPLFGSEELEQFAGSTVELEAVAVNSPKGIQALLQVKAIRRSGLNPFSENVSNEWVKLTMPQSIQVRSMKSWPKDYENTVVLLTGKLVQVLDVVPKQEIDEAEEELGLDFSELEKKSYWIERYSWRRLAEK